MCMMTSVWEGLQTFQKNVKAVLVEGLPRFNIPTSHHHWKKPTMQSKAKQIKQSSTALPPTSTHKKTPQKTLLLWPLWHSSNLFISNKAPNAVLCPVLATAVEKTYEPVVVNAEYGNENYDSLFIAKKVYSWKQFFEDYCSCKIRKLFFIHIPWTTKRRQNWQVIIDIIMMSNKLDISKSLLLEFFWKYWEPYFENYLGIIVL